MTRASISLTPPNDEWIQAQIDSEEYTSRSDVLNDLVRRAREDNRERDWIRAKLIAAEQTPISKLTQEQITARTHEKARKLGLL